MNWVGSKIVDLFLNLRVDRGLLKIMEEEFYGPPANVSIHFSSFFFSMGLIFLFKFFLVFLFLFFIFWGNTGYGRIASRVSSLYVGGSYSAGEIPLNTSPF